MSENNINSEKSEKYKKYIHYKFGSFAVQNDMNGVLVTFGRFKSEDIACAATNLLIKYNWLMSDVANDLVSSYLDKTYVFKLMNNNLIFDRKFGSYEEAIEYLEINSKCNDYHNDIFSKKKRKSKYVNIINDLAENEADIPNIYPKKGLFLVKYKPNGKEYGVFNSIEEAIVAKNLLIKNNWKFSNSVEMTFYDSFYWIFKIEDNVLSFINKFKSYEDALDCLNLVKSGDYVDVGLISEKSIKKTNKKHVEKIKKESYKIEDKYKKSTSRTSNFNSSFGEKIPKNSVSNPIKKKTKNKKKKRKPNNPKDQYYIPRIKHKLTRNNIEIRNVDEINKGRHYVNVKNLKSEFHIIRFQDNILKDYYSISFSSQGKIIFSSNIQEFIECEYILKMLIFYEWNLTKMDNSSSIHYINNSYYIIKPFNDKLIISGSFDSYGEAEDNIEFLHNYYSTQKIIPNDIKKYGDYYKYIGHHNGKTFEIAYQKSFETLMAIIDILEHYNWNPLEFEDYNIYYYNGIYWNLDCNFNYYIKLKGRFYSKEDAIKNKLS